MEPTFTQTISSRFICDYLYFYYWLAVVVAVMAAFGTVGAVIAMKGSLLTKVLVALPNLFVSALAVLTALSLYIICERGLRPEASSNKGGRSAEGFYAKKKA
jgi:hypothetical protein